MQTTRFTYILATTLALTLGACSGAHEVSAPADQAIAANTLIIDVRSQQEWDTGHIDSATLIPHTEIAARIAAVAPDKSQPIALYCRSGGRAGKAKAELEAMGYTRVENWGSLEQARAQLGQ